MSIDVLQSTETTLVIEPPERIATPSCTLTSPAGSQIGTPAAALDSVNTTITSSDKPFRFVVDDATGIVVGRPYLLSEASGWSAIVTVSAVDGTTITIVGGLSELPEAGSTFQGVAIVVSLTAEHTSTRGTGYRLRVYEDDQEHVEIIHVVRQLFAPPISAEQVRKRVSRVYASGNFSAQDANDVAAEAERLVRERILQQARYPDLYGDPEAFRTAGISAADYVLLRDYGLAPPGEDRERMREVLRDQYRLEVGEALDTLSYDSDDDGALDDETPTFGWIQLIRG